MESARMLVEGGADVNEAAPGGLNALLVAIDSGHEDFAIFLVEKGANPNAADRDGLTALHYALRKGFTYLKLRPARRSLRRDRLIVSVPAQHAGIGEGAAGAWSESERPGREGRKKESDASKRFREGRLAGATPFLLAAATGDVGIMRTLLAKGADPKLATNDGVTPLMVAAGVGLADDRLPEEAKGALEAVKMLVEMGADVNAANKDGLDRAARRGIHGSERNHSIPGGQGRQSGRERQDGTNAVEYRGGRPQLAVGRS